jgi:predicted dienelactone hydrolase
MKVRTLALFVLISGLALAQTYPPAAAATIKNANITLHDAARNKDLPLRVVYPEGKGALPVVIFSHDAGGSREGYSGLTEYWAQHGYICLQPTHADSFEQQRAAGRNATLFSALYDSSVSPDAWTNRIKDAVLVLDSFDEIQKQVPALKGRMDKNRIGVGGHAFGAFVAQALGGATIKFPGENESKSFRDARVKAVLLFSPQGADVKVGLINTSWNQFNLPMLSVSGSRDYGDWRVLNKERATPEWRKDSYKFSPPGDKYLLWIKDASHMSFTGMPATESGPLAKRSEALGINEKAIFEWTQLASLAFWDTYLKDEKNARKFLETDELAKMANGGLTLEPK